MKRKVALSVISLLLALFLLPLWAEEPVDLGMINRIREEGFHRSQVMDTAFHLTDVLGPRLTGSPELKAANDWTRKQFESWGLVNAHLEGYPFGRGWSYSAVQVRMIAPRTVPLYALPKAWAPGTNGPVRGDVMRVDIKSEKDFDRYRGKIAGKVLLIDDAAKFEEPDTPAFRRQSAADLEKAGAFRVPNNDGRDERRRRGLERAKLRKALNEFLEKEKVVATLEPSGLTNGIIRVSSGGSYTPGESVGVPALVMAAEHYNEVMRLVEDGEKVQIEVDVAARYHDDDPQAYNTVAEIQGTDKKDEIVMAGAHLDSWHAGTGATDNGAGCVVVMEAARILKALGVKPRRTIRFALWTGEEEGLIGSRMYVKQHFATRPENKDPKQKDLPEFFRTDTWPIQDKPEHAKLAAYFNLDNGTGKVRGIYAEENAAVQPIFAAWIAPFADLGVTALSPNPTGGTDHQSFDRVGLPGFQFVQDPMDYESRTHHTNLDTYDHLHRDDLEQASVVMASFLYNAAMRPEPLPRKPMPREPPPSKKKPGEEESGRENP
ncbi:MAG TPA: M20/M25/M40 family metallo-hydrolase [Thermoanaerobaculia bacterium]|nr:M20/M25/M40 family metallo-hydrolase [Thermoanaerobaculia bacterium]